MLARVIRRPGVVATLGYTAIAILMTWPLARDIDHQIATDLGDPVFNAWVLLWTGGQVLAFLGGDFSALNRFWYGNIFFPEPLTIAYSEHLVPQMLQALPILAITDNVVLAYNLLFLSTFVLSGLGTFLLVRDLTGRSLAAFVAGVAFAFAPYRFAQLSHLQVLSVQWMPMVLYGFRRFLDTGRRRPLIGGSAALVAQNLSCGYYMLFFAPFAGAYVVYELAARRRLRDWTTWRSFIVAAIGVAIATLPFVLPYLDVRSSGFGVRSLGEIEMFSADTHAFVTPPQFNAFWRSWFSGFEKPEGEGFPGLAITALATLGIAVELRRRWRGGLHRLTQRPPWKQVTMGGLIVLLPLFGFASALMVWNGLVNIPVRDGWMQYRTGGSLLLTTLSLIAVWLITWRRIPERSHGTSSPWLFYAVATLLAAAFALGPQVTAGGHPVAAGPYALLMHYLPGFDGLRVPARYLMLVALFLAVLAGQGAAILQARLKRLGAIIVTTAALFMLVETWPGPFPMNVRLDAGPLEVTPRELKMGRDIPPIYKVIRDSPDKIVLIEFPFGNPAWDLHSVFYAGYHRQRLVNGYSGFFPDSQQRLIGVFSRRRTDPQTAWRAVLGSQATHALVHEAAFPEGSGQDVINWLRSSGAKEVIVDGTDHLFTLR